ncbi:MAG: protein-disulfide reductase DsbD domain-containing protein [Tepidisphaeraceae bacterium]
MAIGKSLALGVLCCLMAARASAAQVRAELLANVSSVQAGKPFWLGVRLSIDPGWHVYWKNPGDAGLPTRVTYTLPDGFSAGPLQFPTPLRYDQPGNIVAFGYENSVLLLTRVTPPANLPADFQGEFRAAVSWLVCSNVCIQGKQTVDLTLGSATPASPANQELFDDWIRQLPVDAGDCPNVADVRSRADNTGECVIEITWRDGAADSVEFLPGVLEDYNISNTTVSTNDKTTVIRFKVQPLAGTAPPPTTLQAVVGYASKEGKRRGVNVSLVLGPAGANNH